MHELQTSEAERSCLDSIESRERFLRWHYGHCWIYIRLRELALSEYASKSTAVTIRELISRYEEEQTMKGCETPTEVREYARYYQGLLSSSLILWRLLSEKTVSRRPPIIQ